MLANLVIEFSIWLFNLANRINKTIGYYIYHWPIKLDCYQRDMLWLILAKQEYVKVFFFVCLHGYKLPWTQTHMIYKSRNKNTKCIHIHVYVYTNIYTVWYFKLFEIRYKK
jgi:hypothetical protein